LRYLKIGGRIFLVVGVVIDTVQLGAAGYESYQTGSAKPVAEAGSANRNGMGGGLGRCQGRRSGRRLAGVENGPRPGVDGNRGRIDRRSGGILRWQLIADWLFDD
jgi:hypothetical protein